jgi:hypothetical protein
MKWTDVLKIKARSLSKCAPAVITVLLAIAVCQTSPAALAQAATPQGVSAENCHGPEGSWIYTVTIPGYSFLGLETYSAGGGYSEADQLSFSPVGVASAGHGVWKCTGERTFLLTYLNLTFDAFSSGNPTGTLVVRQATTIDKTGKSYTGSGDYTYLDLKGNPIPSISGTFTITAQRIFVDAPK